MMGFFQNETGKVPCSFAHSFLGGHLLRRCPKYRSESVFLLSGGQGYNVSRRPLITFVRLEEQILCLWQSQTKIVFDNTPRPPVDIAGYCFRHSATKFFICPLSARPLNSGITVFITFPRSFISAIPSSEITS